MLHTCDQRFDVTGNLENFCELNKALLPSKSLNFFKILCQIESLNACMEY